MPLPVVKVGGASKQSTCERVHSQREHGGIRNRGIGGRLNRLTSMCGYEGGYVCCAS